MPPLAVEGAWKGRELIKIHQKSLKTRHFYHFFSTSLDSSVGWAVDSSARGPGFKSRQEQKIKFCWNIAFFDQKKGVYERDFALPSLRIPLRVPKLYLGWYWSSNCDVQSSSCARVRTRAPSYQMERSQCMLSYNSTCRFNTGGDRNAACTIQGAGARRVVFYIYIREWVPMVKCGHIIHQNAGNREPVDLVR